MTWLFARGTRTIGTHVVNLSVEGYFINEAVVANFATAASAANTTW